MSKFTEEDAALLAELGIEAEVRRKTAFTAREEKIIADFEEIQNFITENGRLPTFGENKDIFERIYATRLEAIRRQPDCVELLTERDHQDLLNESLITGSGLDDLDDDVLLSGLGLEPDEKNSDITQLTHVKRRSEVNRRDEIGQRTVCKDFEKFKPLFKAISQDIKTKKRKIIPYAKDSSVEVGNVFILSGQMVYVAEIGELFTDKGGKTNARSRFVFDNGVESNQLRRSFKARLWEDKSSRRITDISMGPLFENQSDEEDEASGTIYIARSHSTNSLISKNRYVVHKIGVTTNDIKSRLSRAKDDPTFLFAEAELVASYELYNIKATKLEKLLHKFFDSVRLKIEIPDRFGKTYKPQEWFVVSLDTISEAIDLLIAGKLENYTYDRDAASLMHMDEK
ncbi:GIY-YIG nuclease family protein [Gammaproteobacteria bacterium]|nr:GIY-YIG nuclease family protein [Gammaproteobacteria bacterium]